MYEPKPEEIARVGRCFVYHPPVASKDQPGRYETIRQYGKQFALQLLQMCPASRELSLALTKLEEAVMWANASIARNEKA